MTTISYQQQYLNALQWLDIYDVSNDNFLKSLKDQIARKKRLSPKQVTWLVKKFTSSTSTGAPKSPLTIVPPHITDAAEQAEIVKFAIGYNGTFKFMLDMQSRLVVKKEGLTPAQWNGVHKCYLQEAKRANKVVSNTNMTHASTQQLPAMIDLPTPIPVVLNRTAAMRIKHKHNLMFGPFAVEIIGFNPKRSRKGIQTFKIRVNGSGAVNVCRICGKSLKDHKSVVSGIGPVCAKGLGQLYHTYQTDIQKFMQQFADECNRIGVIEVDFSLYQVKDNMQHLQMEMEAAYKNTLNGNVVPVPVNSTPPVPAPVLTPVNVEPVTPFIDYDPDTKYIQVINNGLNQRMEFHISEENFQSLLVSSGIALVAKSFKLRNTKTATSVLFNRVDGNSFKGQNMDKVIFFNITPTL